MEANIYLAQKIGGTMKLKEVIKEYAVYPVYTFTREIKGRETRVSFFKMGLHRIISKIVVPIVSVHNEGKEGEYLWLDGVEVKDIHEIFPKIGISKHPKKKFTYQVILDLGEEFARGVGRLINITSHHFPGLNQIKFWELGEEVLFKNKTNGKYFIKDMSTTILMKDTRIGAIGDINCLWRICKNKIVESSNAVFIHSNPKSREIFYTDKKSIEKDNIPMVYNKGNRVFFKKEVLKGSDYFPKNFGEFPSEKKTILVVKYAAGLKRQKAAALGLGFGDIVAIDDKEERYFPVTKLRGNIKFSAPDGIKLAPRSFVNEKTGESRIIWRNSTSFKDGIIGYNGASPVSIPYIHKNLSVAFIVGRHTITYLYRKVGISEGDKLQISIKGMVRDVIDKKSFPKELKKQLEGVNYIASLSGNQKYPAGDVLKHSIVCKLNGAKWVCDIINCEIFTPYWGEFRSNFCSKGAKIGLKVIIDRLITTDNYNVYFAMRRMRALLRRNIVIGGSRYIEAKDILNANNAESEKERLDNFLKLEDSNLMLGKDRITLLGEDLVIGNEVRRMTSLTKCLIKYANGKMEDKELIKVWIDTLLNKIGSNGLPSLSTFAAKSVTVNSIDDNLIPDDSILRKGKGLWIIFPNHWIPFIQQYFPSTLGNRLITAIRYPKLAVGATVPLRYYFKFEVPYDEMVLGGLKSVDKDTDRVIINPEALSLMGGDCDGDTITLLFHFKGMTEEVIGKTEDIFYPEEFKHVGEYIDAIEGKEAVEEEYTPAIEKKLDKQSVAANSIGLFTNRLTRTLLHTLNKSLNAKDFIKNHLEGIEALALETENKSAKYKTAEAIEWVNEEEINWKIFRKASNIDFGNKYRNATYIFMTTGYIANVTGNKNATMREKLYIINRGLAKGTSKLDILFLSIFDMFHLFKKEYPLMIYEG